MAETESTRTVCVTGASGFIASHIVEQCLAKGWTVRGTVRDINADSKTKHLMALPGASDRLSLFQSDLIQKDSFVEPFKDCDTVIHTATPLLHGGDNEEVTVYNPAIQGTEEVLRTMGMYKTIKTLVLTSSMAAVAPKPEPPIKDETCWSDSAAQKAKNNWYGAAKTDQEKMCEKWAKEHEVRFVAICPTLVLGPVIGPKIGGTMKFFQELCGGKMKTARNDSMSFIDVRDTAAHHVKACENSALTGRFMSVVESWHWNKILGTIAKMCEWTEEPTLYAGPDEVATATKFNPERMNSLGVKCRDVDTILQDSWSFLKSRSE